MTDEQNAWKDGGRMSLFDLQPLSADEIRQRMLLGQDGVTIRKVSSTGKVRTIRHKPWWMLLGKGPEGKTCGDCQFLRRKLPRYFKCGKAQVTSGPGTDIRKGDAACRQFVEIEDE